MKIKSVKKAPVKKVVVKKSIKGAAKKCATKKCATKNVTFSVHTDKDRAVYLAGSFNNWDPTCKKMTYKAKSGTFTTVLKLAPGEYQYKFVIDGTWCADPENVNSIPNDQGTFNSVITVK